MTITSEILNAFKHFHPDVRQGPSAIFLKIGNEYAYSIDMQGQIPIVGSIPADDIGSYVDKWSATHRIEIISSLNKEGKPDVPDISRIQQERELDI